MASKTNFRVRVMKQAWHLFRTTGDIWKNCIRKAWELYHLAKRMKKEIVTFFYIKSDGTLRKAQGTLPTIHTAPKKQKAESFSTMKYFDIDKNAFRCFKIENLLCVH